MHINCHFDFASLAPLKECWNELSGGVPFRRWEWIEAWWRHYGCDENGRPKRDHGLFVLTVWDENNQLMGIAPWYRHVTRSGARAIRFLGDGEVCSDYLTVLCRAGHEQNVTAALADWLTLRNQNSSGRAASNMAIGELAHNRPTNRRPQTFNSDCRWDRLEFIGVAEDDAVMNSLLSQLQIQGSVVHSASTMNLWRISLPSSWEEFLMVLSKPHRNRLRRADKTYVQSGIVQLHRVSTTDEIGKFFDIFIDLHQRNWQRRGVPGCFASRPFEALHRELAARFFADGLVTMSWLEMEGRPLAAEYRLHGDKVMYAYQCGMDPDRPRVQPGELANMASIRHAIECGQQAYDFLRGDEPYKAHWRAEPQPMLTIRVIPKQTTARLRHNAWLAGQNVKQWIKSGIRLANQWMPAPAAQKQLST